MKKIFDLMARFGRRKKTALVLSSGAARGLAHIGVIKAMEEGGIYPDLIVGSSIGALVGACYAKNKDMSEFEKIVLETDWKRALDLADFSFGLMPKGIIHGEKITKLLKTILGDITFTELKIPLIAVATDLETGEEIAIKDGLVIDAVRASISMPAIFVPVRFRNKFLIDGGIVNPVPIDIAKQAGAEFIIASNALPHPREMKPIKEKTNANIPDTPGMLDVFTQAFFTMEYEIAKSKLKDANILIEPNIARISSLEFYRGKEAINEGYIAAKKLLNKPV